MGVEKLKKLLIDGHQIAEDLILECLDGVVALDSKTGEIYPGVNYSKLNAEGKIAAFLMARKAAHLLGLISMDAASAKEIRERSGMPMGTVNPKLRALIGKGVVAQNDAREYYMPSPGLRRARAIIKGGEDER
jgi:hypothetical protein